MRAIYITEVDLERLRELVGVARSSAELDQADLIALQEELNRASIVAPQTVPFDVITIHSRFRVRDLGTGKEIAFTLVYPRAADLEQGKISVMSPLGTLLLGCRSGDVLDWRLPDGVCQLQIVEIDYQPEAAGHFHL